MPQTHPVIVSLASLASQETRTQLDLACRRWGFFQIQHHGVRASLLSQLRDELRYRSDGEQNSQLLEQYYRACEPISYQLLYAIFENLCLTRDLLEGLYSPQKQSSHSTKPALTVALHGDSLKILNKSQVHIVHSNDDALTVLLGSVADELSHQRYVKPTEYSGNCVLFQLTAASQPHASRESLQFPT